jgi:cell division septation protein DedD
MPKATKIAAKPMTKSDFIRKFSFTTPASDIVTKAKPFNLKFTPSFVYAIRAMDKKRKRVPSQGKPAAVAVSTAASSAVPTRGKSINKSAFVRGLPATLSASDVISRGRAQGIKLTAAQVYTVRANAKRAGSKAATGKLALKAAPKTVATAAPKAVAKAARKPAGKRGPKPGTKAAAKASPALAQTQHPSHDHHFVSLVLNIGLAKAEALLARVREKVLASL